MSSLFRLWTRLDKDKFMTLRIDSLLCDLCARTSLDAHWLALLYNSTMCHILDNLIPVRVSRRPSDPWFDDEYRCLKRSSRRLERFYVTLKAIDSPIAKPSSRFQFDISIHRYPDCQTYLETTAKQVLIVRPTAYTTLFKGPCYLLNALSCRVPQPMSIF